MVCEYTKKVLNNKKADKKAGFRCKAAQLLITLGYHTFTSISLKNSPSPGWSHAPTFGWQFLGGINVSSYFKRFIDLC